MYLTNAIATRCDCLQGDPTLTVRFAGLRSGREVDNYIRVYGSALGICRRKHTSSGECVSCVRGTALKTGRRNAKCVIRVTDLLIVAAPYTLPLPLPHSAANCL